MRMCRTLLGQQRGVGFIADQLKAQALIGDEGWRVIEVQREAERRSRCVFAPPTAHSPVIVHVAEITHVSQVAHVCQVAHVTDIAHISKVAHVSDVADVADVVDKLVDEVVAFMVVQVGRQVVRSELLEDAFLQWGVRVRGMRDAVAAALHHLHTLAQVISARKAVAVAMVTIQW